MDEEFLEQLDQARRMQTGRDAVIQTAEPSRSRVESALSPRDIQTRLRAGRTVAQVAAEAGVSIEWVERFAAPVLAEQAAAVERAYATTMRTQRRGHSDRPLGPSVLRNLADRGIRLADDEFDQLWTAFQLAENEWVIRFRHRWRGRELYAEWVLDDGAGSLTPGNRQATELGYVDPGRHAPAVKGLPPMRVLRRPADLRSPPHAVVAAAGVPAGTPAEVSKVRKVTKKPRAVKAAKKARTSAGRAARPLTVKRATAKKATVKKATAKKATAKKATVKRSAGKKRVPNKTAARKAVAKRPLPKKPIARKTPAQKTMARKTPAPVSATGPAPRRERPLKAVRIGHNGKSHSAVRSGRVSTNGTVSRRAAPVSRAGGNGSRRPRT